MLRKYVDFFHIAPLLSHRLLMQLLCSRDFLRNIVPNEQPLLPRELERILARLDREKWIRMTKMGGSPDQFEDSRQRGVWFGPRAIAEFPQVSRELRRRRSEGPRSERRLSGEQVPREEAVSLAPLKDLQKISSIKLKI